VLAQERRVEGAFALFVLSAAVKYLSAALGLLYFVHAVASEATARRRLVRAARLAGVAAVLLAALYGPFLAGDMLGHALEHLSGGRNLGATPRPTSTASMIAVAGVALLSVVSLVVAARAPLGRVVEMGAAVLFAFLTFIFQYKFSWYYVSALALTAAGPRTRSNRVLLVLTLTMGLFCMLTYSLLFKA